MVSLQWPDRGGSKALSNRPTNPGASARNDIKGLDNQKPARSYADYGNSKPGGRSALRSKVSVKLALMGTAAISGAQAVRAPQTHYDPGDCQTLRKPGLSSVSCRSMSRRLGD